MLNKTGSGATNGATQLLYMCLEPGHFYVFKFWLNVGFLRDLKIKSNSFVHRWERSVLRGKISQH